MSEQALSKFMSEEAKKKGISDKDARKALKKLKGGGMMAQLAPQLHSQFMELDPLMTPREKLRQKIRRAQEGRTCKVAKDMSYERTRKEMQEREEKEKAEKELAAQAKRNHRKRIKELGKRLGTVTQELYNRCLQNLQEDKYKDPSMRNRDKNIVELYAQQQEFKETIDLGDMDEI